MCPKPFIYFKNSPRQCKSPEGSKPDIKGCIPKWVEKKPRSRERMPRGSSKLSHYTVGLIVSRTGWSLRTIVLRSCPIIPTRTPDKTRARSRAGPELIDVAKDFMSYQHVGDIPRPNCAPIELEPISKNTNRPDRWHSGVVPGNQILQASGRLPWEPRFTTDGGG